MGLNKLEKYEEELAKAHKMAIKADLTTGEAVELDASFYYKTDPSYVKWYTGCVSKVPALKNGLPGVFCMLLPYIKYADAEDDFGGMYVMVDKTLKSRIAEQLEISFNRVEHTLHDLTKSGVLKRVCMGRYQVNPYIMGKGAWLDIKQVQKQFDDTTTAGMSDDNIKGASVDD